LRLAPEDRGLSSAAGLALRLSAGAPGALDLAIRLIREGQVVAFPTDTVYGLGAGAFQPEAVERLFVVKDRPAGAAIPLLLPGAEGLDVACVEVPSLAWQLAGRFWPGALTLVLRRSRAIPDMVTAGRPTVAVRVPDHPLVRDLCRGLGSPLAATSANLHGQPASVDADEVMGALAGRIPLILDGGRCPVRAASTIVDLTVTPPAILRAGPVTARQLAEFFPIRGVRDQHKEEGHET
jgi:L-threonylcarbamoyladenylate synthase